MKSALSLLIIFIFLIVALTLQKHAPFFLSQIKQLGWLAPLLFLILYFLATLLLLPTMVITLAGGALFGPIWGTLFNLIGATLGAMGAFCISRYLANDWFVIKKGGRINNLIQGVDNKGWQFVALLRLIPIVPFNLVNYGLGITGIKFRSYSITTLIFLAPAEVIYTYCGYIGMDALTHAQSLYVGLAVLFCFCLIIVLQIFNGFGKLIVYPKFLK